MTDNIPDYLKAHQAVYSEADKAKTNSLLRARAEFFKVYPWIEKIDTETYSEYDDQGGYFYCLGDLSIATAEGYAKEKGALLKRLFTKEEFLAVHEEAGFESIDDNLTVEEEIEILFGQTEEEASYLKAAENLFKTFVANYNCYYHEYYWPELNELFIQFCLENGDYTWGREPCLKYLADGN